MSDYSLSNSLEWLNSNMHRNYPIVDNTVVEATTPGVYLPSSFLVDLQLIVPYVEGLDASKFFISAVTRNADSFQITIGYLISEVGANVRMGFDCAVSSAIPVDTVFSGEPYMVRLAAITTDATYTSSTYTYGIPAGYEAMRNIRGAVYIGTCSDMTDVGAMSFIYENAAIMPTCVYIEDPTNTLSSIRIMDSKGTDATLTDDITINLENGIIAEVSPDKDTVTFKMDPDFVERRLNELVQEAFGDSIKTINGIGPDATGDFQLVGLDCTNIASTESGLTISNPCAKPCCDSDGVDSADILKALTDIAAAKDVLNNYYTSMATNVNSLQARLSSLIASRR